MREMKLSDISEQVENLTEDERRALRGSKFTPLPTRVPNEVKPIPRIPHPGGPMATNKAAALAKFLQRKLETASGSLDLNPALVEAAVENAKATLHGFSGTNLKIRHVDTFSDGEKVDTQGPVESNNGQLNSMMKKRKKVKAKKKKCKQHFFKADEAPGKGPLKKAKKGPIT